MRVEANAKINLSLDVVRRREDGYHDLRMIMLPLTLHDVLEVTLAFEDTLVCTDPCVPLDERNLIFRALSYLRRVWGMQAHFRIVLEKNIPMEAGLAGGSADAGAIIRAAIQLAPIDAPLASIAREAVCVGADVPFCVLNQSARVEGIGEQVTPIKAACDFEILLVKPASGVSSAQAYRMLDFTQAEHPDIDLVERCLVQGDYAALCRSLGNTLEYSAFLLNPQVKQLKEMLLAQGADGVLMSGSGSTVFALGRNHEQMCAWMEEYRRMGYFAQLVKCRG